MRLTCHLSPIMKLNKKQKEFVLARVSEGLETDEINRAAAKFKPAFSVLRSQVDYYRKSRGVQIKEIVAASELDALCTGLSIKEARVSILQEVTSKLLLMVRESPAFDEGQYRQLRGLLDDLAKETGGRKLNVEHTGKDGGDLELNITINGPRTSS